ncbi:MAG: hypothetical protein ACTIA6_10260 [Pseudoclavibacter sp.]
MAHHNTPGTDEPTTLAPSRRTIVAGAAWSIPVIAATMAAPAHAASQCDPNVTLDWASNFTRTSNVSGTGSVTTPAGEVITFTLSSALGPRLSIPAGSSLGTNAAGLLISDRQTVAAADLSYDTRYRQRVTITFDTPIQNLRFSIADVDGINSGGSFYREYVAVTGVTATATPGAQVVLSTAADTYRPLTDNPIDETDPAGTVQYVVAGNVTSLNIDITTPGTVASGTGVSHGVRLSDFGFEVPC